MATGILWMMIASSKLLSSEIGNPSIKAWMLRLINNTQGKCLFSE